MLTPGQKANILAKAGIAVPAFPARRLPVQERHLLMGARKPKEEQQADAEQAAAVLGWNQAVENLYVAHVAARAARSLRQAQEAEQLDDLRRANSQPVQTDESTDTDWI